MYVPLQSSASNLVSTLWQLMEGGLEELRILQTIILLITTSNIVHGESLGKVCAMKIIAQTVCNIKISLIFSLCCKIRYTVKLLLMATSLQPL